MNELLYFGWLGHSNLGDETLFEVNKRVFNNYRFTVASLQQYGNKRHLQSGYNPKQKACILGGGTFINEYVNVNPIKEIKGKLPLIIFRAGVRNPEYWEHVPGYINAEKEWNEILSECPFIGVRGPNSISTLEKQGADCSKVRLIGDPVLGLADKEYQTKSKNRRIGINIGNLLGRLWGGDDKVVLNFCRLLIKSLIGLKYEVSLLSVYPLDTEILWDISREFELDLHAYYEYSPEVLDYFRSIDVFVGQKLHSVILAHSTYTPAIMLEYRSKCADYMASVGLEKYNFRCDKLDLDTVLDRIIYANEHGEELQKHLLSEITYYKQAQREFAEEIITWLESRK